MATTEVLDEGMPSDHHTRCAIRLQPAHTSEPGLEPAMVAFDPVVLVLAGVVPRARKQLVTHVCQRRCPVGDLGRVTLNGQGAGEAPNVTDRLPQRLRGPVESRIRRAYHADSALDAHAQLQALARELDKTHPGAAASLREGMDETLTVLRLEVPPTLARTLRSTNAIESMISICREHAKNVKRWRDGQMAMRWCAAGMIEASTQFRRVNGHLHLPALRSALERHVAEQNVSPTPQNETENAA